MPHHLAKMEFLQSGHQLKAQVEQSDDTGERKLAAPWKGPAAQGAARASPAGPMLRLILCLTSVSPCTKRIAWCISLAAMYLHRSRDSHWYQARHCCLYIWSHMICFLAHQRLNVCVYIYMYIYTYTFKYTYTFTYTYATGWTKMVFTVPTYYSWGVIQVLTNMEHVQLVDQWDFLDKTWWNLVSGVVFPPANGGTWWTNKIDDFLKGVNSLIDRLADGVMVAIGIFKVVYWMGLSTNCCLGSPTLSPLTNVGRQLV